MPVLVILGTDKYGYIINTSLYSVTKRKIILERPFPKDDERCCGSSHGWLIFQRYDYIISLFNPFSGETINLPSLSYDVEKAVLSKNPSTNLSDVEVVAIVRCGFVPLWLAILRPGSNEWIFMTHGMSWHVCDVIYYDDSYCVVTSDGIVLSIDKITLDSKEISGPAPVRFSNFTTKFHLIKATTNELLMIHISNPNHMLSSDEPSSVEISKLVVNPMTLESMFVELDDLSNEALFLSEHSSMSFTASKFPGCNANSVCYTGTRIRFETSGFMKDLIHYQDSNYFCMLWIIPAPKFTTPTTF
ncbi:uncharacterized protein LOC107848624 isoform X2 [Capsicum annuum]|uniref:uncharacterized protein LOC107848624 isoform X2 n=1 Tax=Capsicum annuum TaxID=4072 RepID=UPI001FB16179|nr:uncharacterized protein LOC107848624 isoform X2 [Capsicum annuum]XP_016548887.2 uncharacterized protein LOC107848624 isoform X2 [Capsicum annuum]